MSLRVVIVGGVAGGMSTATRLRRELNDAEIIVLERGPHVSYANCGLPYYIGGVITERDDLLLQTPEALKARFDLDVRINTEAIAIDTEHQKVITLDRVNGQEGELSYDRLVLAPGAAPFIPPIPGIGRAFALRTVEDSDAIFAATANNPETAVVLGAGFVGVEVAENLAKRGIKTTIVELADQVLAPFDPELAILVEEELQGHGVDVRLGQAAIEVGADSVILKDKTEIAAELVIAAIGVRPDTDLAARAGIRLNDRGGIVVDDRQRTSAPNVFAVGDAATKRDILSGDDVLVPLAQTANRHGRLVADVIAGRKHAASLPVLGTAVIGVFGLTAAATGWNEKRLQAADLPYRAIHTHPIDHAGYYPGAETMALKLLVDPDTDRILGAQGVGGAGVDKRIDIIATAIRGGLTGSDLADLELAYSPQYGSAKDPVNMLGFIADNLRTGRIESIQWHELDAATSAGAVPLDVRDADEFARGSIPNSLNIPLDLLRERHAELPQGDDSMLIVHCETGPRANAAARLLTQLGYSVKILDGSYRTYSAGKRSQRPQLVAAK